ncbi:SRPBCC family protein [Membranicola marinus]|uniref:SRPBCC family protein n=1 Tax=Membranihabitans marinus TaxID=1227546 RepID=A0A953HUB9_9BACT|nr:SRPBCC family protein [Membranihabitans marinus]MBY5958356.1 SRPBCC family protein [Membranihabitans marinus]
MIFIYIIICLALLVFILSSVAPRSYSVDRKININRPLEAVYEYLRYLRNQDHWAKWNNIDPNMKKTYKGEDGKIGFQSEWESDHKKVGAGQQTITSLDENKAIYTRLEFYKPFKSESDAYLRIEKIDEQNTEVTWGFTGEMNPPMNIMLLFMNMDKQVGNDFEEGLANLKQVLENNGKVKV